MIFSGYFGCAYSYKLTPAVVMDTISLCLDTWDTDNFVASSCTVIFTNGCVNHTVVYLCRIKYKLWVKVLFISLLLRIVIDMISNFTVGTFITETIHFDQVDTPTEFSRDA